MAALEIRTTATEHDRSKATGIMYAFCIISGFAAFLAALATIYSVLK